MAYRQIHIEIWDDPWFLDLHSDGKLLFVYLFSNSRTNMLGLYELSRRQMSFETGLEPNVVDAQLSDFENHGKIRINGTWVWVVNLFVRNVSNVRSPKVQKHIQTLIQDIPHTCPFRHDWILYYNDIVAPQYDIDTISIPYPPGTGTEADTATVADTEQIQESGEDAGPNGPTTFAGWQSLIESEASNRPAILRSMHESLYPGREPPSFSYIGKVARKVGGAGRLAELLWQNSTRPPTGDVLAYVQGVAKGKKHGTNQQKRINIQGHTPTDATPEEFYGSKTWGDIIQESETGANQ